MTARYSQYLIFALITLCAFSSWATRIKDLCEVQGARDNPLKGYGLVVGLAGTGDKTPEAVLAQQRILKRLDVEVASVASLKSENTAVVLVTAEFPPFSKEGTRIDVQVSSLGDCKSLEGGILLNTQLSGDDENVYAVAQGPVSVGGFTAGGGGGGGSRRNFPTVGRVPMGGYVEREIPSTITDGERINLLLKRPDFSTASSISEALQAAYGDGSARALGAGSVNVKIPSGQLADLVGFISEVQNIPVDADMPARVVINERTGTLVVGGDVAVRPCQIAHGNLTIEVGVTPILPPAPLLGQETRQAEKTDVTVTEPDAHLAPIGGASAGEIANTLNRLKVTPRDMIAIFQALRAAGALEADLEIM